MRIHDCARNSLALRRSRQCPLDITFDLGRDFGVDAELASAPFVEVCSYLARWRTAELIVEAETNLHPLETPAPMLETLSLEREGVLPPYSCNLFRGEAPRLQSLELSRVSIPWRSGTLTGCRV